MQCESSRLLSACFGCWAVVLLVSQLVVSVDAAKLTQANAENCEVCVKFLDRFLQNLPAEAKGDSKKIEKEFIKACKIAKKDDNRFCYYVGGTEDSATSTLNDLTKPASWGVPADKICMKLYRKDAQICDLKYDKLIDLATINLKKLKVKDLKKILTDWDDSCRGCTEKSDYIRRIEELMPKYAPDAAQARAKSEL